MVFYWFEVSENPSSFLSNLLTSACTRYEFCSFKVGVTLTLEIKKWTLFISIIISKQIQKGGQQWCTLYNHCSLVSFGIIICMYVCISHLIWKSRSKLITLTIKAKGGGGGGGASKPALKSPKMKNTHTDLHTWDYKSHWQKILI